MSGRKLTDEQVLTLRWHRIHETGRVAQLGRQYGVSPRTAHDAAHGFSYPHVSGEPADLVPPVGPLKKGGGPCMLTPDQVRSLRAAHEGKTRKIRALAREFGVSVTAAWFAATGRRYKDVV